MCRVGGGIELPAWLLGRRLHVETAVDQPGDGLQVPLRLEVATRGAPNQDRCPVLIRDQVAVEGVHRPLARRVDVRVAVLQLEAVAGAVGEEDAGVTGDDRRSVDLAERVKISEIIRPSASMTQSEVVSPAAIFPASIVDANRESIVA